MNSLKKCIYIYLLTALAGRQTDQAIQSLHLGLINDWMGFIQPPNSQRPHLHERLPQVGLPLHQLAVLFKEGTEEQAEVLDEVLLVILPIGVGQADVGVEGQHLNMGDVETV